MKVVYLFSGQGSQYRGMGKQLFDNNTVFRESLLQSDRIVRRHINRSLIDALYHVNQEPFDELLITHPAIVAVEIAMWHVLQNIGLNPDYVCGNSLGEFAAGVAGGIWDAETAIEAAIEQAKSVLQGAAEGGMLAVMNGSRSTLEALYQKHGLYLASDNFEGHFTLSGTVRDLDIFQAELDKSRYSSFRLPVTFPFHSPLIESGRNGFMHYLASVPSLASPLPGFISGIDGKEHSHIPYDYFWDIARKYTNFPETVALMEQRGPCIYIDLGPSGTSATFVKYNLNPDSLSRIYSIMTPYKREIHHLEDLHKAVSRLIS